MNIIVGVYIERNKNKRILWEFGKSRIDVLTHGVFQKHSVASIT